MVDDLARGAPSNVGAASTASADGGRESAGEPDVLRALAISSSVVINIPPSASMTLVTMSQYDASSSDGAESDVAAVVVGSPSLLGVNVGVEVEEEVDEGVRVLVETTEIETSSASRSISATASASDEAGRTSVFLIFPFPLAMTAETGVV
jgi:hypothetical protein